MKFQDIDIKLTRRQLLTSGGAGLSIGLAGCTGSARSEIRSWDPDPGSWPLVGYDPENSRYNPDASPPLEAVSEKWSRSVDGELDGMIGANGTLVGFSGDGLWAFDVETGDQLWETTTSTNAAGIFDETVYTCGSRPDEDEEETAYVRAHDLADGDSLYDHTPAEHTRAFWDLCPTEEYVFVSSADKLYGIERESGETLWEEDGHRRLAVTDGAVVTSGGDSLAKIRTRRLIRTRVTGWERAVPEPDSRPSIGSDRVYTGHVTGDGEAPVYAYEFDSGAESWQSESIGSYSTTPAIDGEIGYSTHWLGDGTERIVAINLETGEHEWVTDAEGGTFRLILTDDLVLAYGYDGNPDDDPNGRLLALDREGHEQWRYDLDHPPAVPSEPAVFDGTIVLAGDEGQIVALGS